MSHGVWNRGRVCGKEGIFRLLTRSERVVSVVMCLTRRCGAGQVPALALGRRDVKGLLLRVCPALG